MRRWIRTAAVCAALWCAMAPWQGEKLWWGVMDEEAIRMAAAQEQTAEVETRDVVIFEFPWLEMILSWMQ